MKVLVGVDLQNDYISGALANEEAKKALCAIEERIKKAHGEGEQVFFLRDTHGANYLNTAEGRSFPTMHCVVDTEGWKLIDGLFDEGKNDSLIDKTAYGSVRLAAVIGKIDPDEVEIFGFGAEKGILSNAIIMRSALRETRITVNSSLCAAQTPEALENTLSALRLCGVNVI